MLSRSTRNNKRLLALRVLPAVFFGLGYMAGYFCHRDASVEFMSSFSLMQQLLLQQQEQEHRQEPHQHLMIQQQQEQLKNGDATASTTTTTPIQKNEGDEDDDDGWKSIDVFYGKQVFPDGVSNTTASKTQANQDKIVAGMFRNKRNGYFVDLAANDAFDMSNTYPLEQQYNWNGLCIEANPKYWRSLAFYRKCKVVGAVVGGQNRMEQVDFHFDKWGGVGGGIVGATYDNKYDDKSKTTMKTTMKTKMYTVNLEEILRRDKNTPSSGIIDYLSLDVEGAEHFIMQGFPFHKYRVRVMTVERPKKEFHDLLEKHGYCCVARISDFGETLWISLNDGESSSSSSSDLDMGSVKNNAKRFLPCQYGKTCQQMGLLL